MASLSPPIFDRADVVRRGLRLNYITLAYNCFEAVVALAAGVIAGSVSLVGFGTDSVIEVIASVTAQWRLRVDRHSGTRARSELVARRIIGGSFLALAAYIVYDGAMTLWNRERPERSLTGVMILLLSVIVMPLLARAKHRVARTLESRALSAEATQTSLCAYLSVIALAGVGLNAAVGWWWADPVAALAMVPIIAREGVDGVRARGSCDDCC